MHPIRPPRVVTVDARRSPSLGVNVSALGLSPLVYAALSPESGAEIALLGAEASALKHSVIPAVRVEIAAPSGAGGVDRAELARLIENADTENPSAVRSSATPPKFSAWRSGPDGHQLASGSLDRTVRVANSETKRLSVRVGDGELVLDHDQRTAVGMTIGEFLTPAWAAVRAMPVFRCRCE
jgi:hypothetical protein